MPCMCRIGSLAKNSDDGKKANEGKHAACGSCISDATKKKGQMVTVTGPHAARGTS